MGKGSVLQKLMIVQYEKPNKIWLWAQEEFSEQIGFAKVRYDLFQKFVFLILLVLFLLWGNGCFWLHFLTSTNCRGRTKRYLVDKSSTQLHFDGLSLLWLLVFANCDDFDNPKFSRETFFMQYEFFSNLNASKDPW